MTALLSLLSGIAMAAGSTLIYLCSPNQKWLSRALAARLWVPVGLGVLLVALVILLQISGPAAAVFILFTGVMLIWSLLPFPVALWRGPKRRQK
jgi:hypothetical protein